MYLLSNLGFGWTEKSFVLHNPETIKRPDNRAVLIFVLKTTVPMRMELRRLQVQLKMRFVVYKCGLKSMSDVFLFFFVFCYNLGILTITPDLLMLELRCAGHGIPLFHMIRISCRAISCLEVTAGHRICRTNSGAFNRLQTVKSL